MATSALPERVNRVVIELEEADEFHVLPNQAIIGGDRSYVAQRIEIYRDFIRVLGRYPSHGGPLRELGIYDQFGLSLSAPGWLMTCVARFQKTLPEAEPEADMAMVH